MLKRCDARWARVHQNPLIPSSRDYPWAEKQISGQNAILPIAWSSCLTDKVVTAPQRRGRWGLGTARDSQQKHFCSNGLKPICANNWQPCGHRGRRGWRASAVAASGAAPAPGPQPPCCVSASVRGRRCPRIAGGAKVVPRLPGDRLAQVGRASLGHPVAVAASPGLPPRAGRGACWLAGCATNCRCPGGTGGCDPVTIVVWS